MSFVCLLVSGITKSEYEACLRERYSNATTYLGDVKTSDNLALIFGLSLGIGIPVLAGALAGVILFARARKKTKLLSTKSEPSKYVINPNKDTTTELNIP